MRTSALGAAQDSLEMAADGGLTLYVQKDSPGKDKEANWLPAPDGDFWVVFRLYCPGPKIVEQTWKMPPLEKTK
jgi:hypothetical protein